MKTTQHRHRVLFNRDEEIEAITLARFGVSDRTIMLSTGLSHAQTTYRLHKWNKQVLHLSKGTTERFQWRNGQSPMLRALLTAHRPDVKREALEAAKQLEKPEPNFVQAKEETAAMPTVNSAIRQLKRSKPSVT